MVSEINDSDLGNKLFDETNMSDVIIDFCKDIDEFDHIFEIDSLFNDMDYCKEKIDKHFAKFEKLIASMINSNFRGAYGYEASAIIYYDLTKMIRENSFNHMLAFLRGLRGAEKIELNFNLKPEIFTDLRYCSDIKNVFERIIYLSLAGMCVAKLIFIQKKIRKLDQNCEFYKIVSNMAAELKDIDFIVKKTRPLYDEFYKAELDFMEDDILYQIAITMMVNSINEEMQINKEKYVLDFTDQKACDIESFNKIMDTWLCKISKSIGDSETDIGLYITHKIMHSINTSDLNLYMKTLSKTRYYIELYNKYAKHHTISLVKDRYVSGDFSNEKDEISRQKEKNETRCALKHIPLGKGKDFEVFLTQLFEKLEYEATHTGKTGDQGADLILKKGNYKYAVQAKFYNTGKLNNAPVQEVVASLNYYNADQGVVITTSTFTDGAYDLARVNNVILIDKKGLNKLIDYMSSKDKHVDVLQQFSVPV